MQRAERPRRVLLALAAVLVWAGVTPGPGPAGAVTHAQADTIGVVASPREVPREGADAVREAMRGVIASSRFPALDRPGLRPAREQLALVYGDQPAPVWVDATGRPTPAARAALAVLRDAAADGLRPADYGAVRLDSALARLTSAMAPEARTIAGFDVALTTGLLRYATDLHVGRVAPRGLGFALGPREDLRDIPALVASAIATGQAVQALQALRPALPQYTALRAALTRYRALAGSAPVRVPAPQASIRPGDAWAGAPITRRFLMQVGDLAEGGEVDSLRYDASLAAAVARFQDRHGLTPDSVLGRATAAAMQVPLTDRAVQLELAMERFRWLPGLGSRYILVNIPTFQLWAWDTASDSGMPALRMRVVAGEAVRTETPVLQAELTHLIFRPYWNVPRSIAVEEILPAIRRRPGYLERNAMELVAGPGDDARPVPATEANIARFARGELRVRQRPGPQNALGLVKFVFPNDRSIYMHDTPATGLFRRARRDFSHGCVRLERPVDLAEWAMAGTVGWDRPALRAAMDGPGMPTVRLAQAIPVVVFYATAMVEADGLVRFAADIYGHDARLARALGARARP